MSKKLLAALAVSGLTAGAFPRTLGSTRRIDNTAGTTIAGLYITADNAGDGGGPANLATTDAKSAADVATANTMTDTGGHHAQQQQQQQAGANTGQADGVKAGVTQEQQQQQQQQQ